MNSNALWYGVFVGGVTIGILCFALLIMTHLAGIAATPGNILYIIGLAPLWFYGRTASRRRNDQPHTYARNAAVVLLTGFLACYFVPHLFRFLAFPSYAPGFAQYQHYALPALIASLLLFRLHACGGGIFGLIAGSIAGITALFFLLTAVPGLFVEYSPPSVGETFQFFTLVAVLLSYAVLLSIGTRGWLKYALLALGDMEKEVWHLLRKVLFFFLVGVTHLLFGMTLLFHAGQQLLGVLFLLMAGLWIITGVQFEHVVFYSAAYLEVVAAIFSCRFFPSFCPETWIIWLLIVLFIALIPLYSLFLKPRYEDMESSYYPWLAITAGLVFYEQITFYGVHSSFGIVPLFILWLAVFFVPAPVSAREDDLFKAFLGLLVYCPALFFLVQQGTPTLDFLPRAVLTVVITSCLIIGYRLYDWQWLSEEDTSEPRIVHHLHWFLIQPHSLLIFFLLSTFAMFVIHWLTFTEGAEMFAGQFLSLLVVQGILAVYWFDLARKAKKWWWTVLAEAMVGGIVFVLRWGLPMQFDLPWTINWDLTIGLIVAVAITAARPLLKHQDKSLRIPIRFTLFGLPIVTGLYALDFQASFEILSRVILLYSIIFLWQAYNEKDRLVLAYAFVGFNAFLILLFLDQEIRSLQAYLTPVCISVLILVQIFRDITSKTTANAVRGVTLLILLGMAMFEAIVQHALSPMSHLLLISLSILAFTAAALLKIRIFAAGGLFCFVVDIIAILVIVLKQQDADLKVVLGVTFTAGGTAILAASLFYLKHKAKIQHLLHRMNTIFSSWE